MSPFLALKRLSNQGWTNVILSKHALELPGILHPLGIDDYKDAIFFSA